MNREKTKTIRIYESDHKAIMEKTGTKVKAWEKRKHQGLKPWNADSIRELMTTTLKSKEK